MLQNERKSGQGKEKKQSNNVELDAICLHQRSQTHASGPGHLALREVKGPIKKLTLWLKRVFWVQFQAGMGKSKTRNPGFCV